MSTKIFHGDCLDALENIERSSIDTCITDPPYGLNFMGSDWDHGVPGEIYWRAIAKVLKPGAMLLAFGGTRTHHRLMCAIEDAGFEIRDVMMWVYGSGFPKSHNISKAIDKAKGAEREIVGRNNNKIQLENLGPAGYKEEWDITVPATSDAIRWDGWGTALKPAWEPIIVAMKPCDGTFANNAVKWGVAGFWINGGRIGTEPIKTLGKRDGTGTSLGWSQYESPEGYAGDVHLGRWPSNVLLTHSTGCKMVGTRKVKGHRGYPRGPRGNRFSVGEAPDGSRVEAWPGHADKDGYETVEVWDCTPDCPVKIFVQRRGTVPRYFYCAKAPTKERWFYCDICEDAFHSSNLAEHIHDDPERGHIVRHPTQKPLALMRYLVRLTATPDGGTVLDHFMGSGSTGEACQLEGRDFYGIDKDRKSYVTTKRRLESTKAAQIKMF